VPTSEQFAVGVLADQAQCMWLSDMLRGSLCERLAQRPGRRLRAGSSIYIMGDAAQSIFYVRSGLVKSSVVSSEGDEMTLRMHHAGDIFGELCLCTGTRRERAVALEKSEIVELLLPELLGQLRSDPQQMLELTKAVCEHVDEAYEKLRSLWFDPAMQRLARELLNLANSLGEPVSEGTRIAYYIRQADIAQLVGVRREVVSGLLNRLREQRLVGYSRKSHIWVDCAGLQSYLDRMAS